MIGEVVFYIFLKANGHVLKEPALIRQLQNRIEVAVISLEKSALSFSCTQRQRAASHAWCHGWNSASLRKPSRIWICVGSRRAMPEEASVATIRRTDRHPQRRGQGEGMDMTKMTATSINRDKEWHCHYLDVATKTHKRLPRSERIQTMLTLPPRTKTTTERATTSEGDVKELYLSLLSPPP